MKTTELQALIDENTVDGELNIEAVNKAVNSQFDALIDAKVTKAKESGKSENVETFIKDQGFDNIDQFNAFVKNTKSTSTELTEKVTRYEQELESLRGENGTLKGRVDEYTHLGQLKNVDPKYQKFVMSEIKGLVNDTMDFEEAKEKYLTDNAHYLADNDTPIVTKVPKGSETLPPSDGIIAALEAKSGIKLE